MNPKLKKILKIAAVALVIFFIGLLIYYIFFKKEAPTTPTGVEEQQVSEEVTPEGKPRLIVITNESIISASLAGENKIIYIAKDGVINKIDYEGNGKAKLGIISSERISEASFSPKGEKLIVKQQLSSGKNSFLLFDTAEKTLKSLQQNLEDAKPGPDGKKILLLVPNGAQYRVVIDDNGKQKVITETKIPDLVLEWVSENTVALKTKPSGIAQGILYYLDLKTAKTGRYLGSVYGLTSLFSPSLEKILFSQTQQNGYGFSLRVFNTKSKVSQSADIESIPEKCAWSQDNRTIFCGIMSYTANLIIPDDYYKGKYSPQNEKIEKINLEINQTQEIISASVNVFKPFLSPDESYLFFINKIDGRLYRLTL